MSANKFQVSVRTGEDWIGGSVNLQRIDTGATCLVKVTVQTGQETITRTMCFLDFVKMMRHAIIVPEEQWSRPRSG